MSRRKKETISRRDFLKATGVMAGSVLLSACSEALQISLTPVPSPTSTTTNTPSPAVTATSTPTETATPTPAPKPKPFEMTFSVEGTLVPMKFPFIYNERVGGEVIDFSDADKLPVLPHIAFLPYYHDALRNVIKNDGSPLVPQFPADVELPEWNLRWPDDLNAQQGLSIQFPHCDYRRQPLIIVGGFRLHVPLVDPNSNDWYAAATLLTVNPKNISETRLVSGLFTLDQLQNAGGLTKNTYFTVPRLGIPDDIRTNVNAAIGGNVTHIAYYMANIDAYKPSEYKNGIKSWADEDYPPAVFQQYPYISTIAQMSSQY